MNLKEKLSAINKSELIQLAKKLKLKYSSRIKKDDLVAQIINNFSEKQVTTILEPKKWKEFFVYISGTVTIIAFAFALIWNISTKKEMDDVKHFLESREDKIISQIEERFKKELRAALMDKPIGEEKEREKILKKFEQGKFDEVVRLLETLKKKERERHGKTSYNLGVVYFLKKDFDKALSAFLEANSLDHANSKYKKSIALTYLIMSKPEKAIGYFEKALSDDIKNSRPIHVIAGDWNNLGLAWFLMKNHEKAIKCYKEAFKVSDKIGNPSYKWIILNNIGFAYYESDHYNEAEKCYEESLKITRKNDEHLGEAKTLNNLGKLYNKLGQYEKSLEFFNKSLVKFELISDISGVAETLFGIGEVYSHQENHNKAVLFFEKAATLSSKSNESKKMEDIYLYSVSNSKSFDMYDKALPFFEKAGYSQSQGNMYLSKGNIYLITGNNSLALKSYEIALHFFKRKSDLKGQGNVYKREGDIYFYKGDYLRALELYNKALIFFEEARDKIGQGNVYSSKGNIYLRIGNYPKSMELYDKALLAFKIARYPVGQGNVYRNKGDFHLYSGEYSKAIEMYNNALNFFEKVGYIIGQGNIYQRNGDIYLRIGNYAKSLELYDKALPFFWKAEYSMGQGNVYLGKGIIYSSTGENYRALEMFDKALLLYYNVGAIESESFALHGKAKVLVKLGKKKKALALFEKGIFNLEKLRRSIPLFGMRMNYMKIANYQYEEAVSFMLDNGFYEKGFKYVENMKQRVFLDRLAEGIEEPGKGLSPELKQKRDNLISKLSVLKMNIAYEARQKGQNRLAELKKELNKIEIELDNLYLEIRQKNPRYASIFYPGTLELKNLQQKILKNDELLLEYFVSKESIYLFVVSREDIKVKKLEASVETIDKVLYEYLKSIYSWRLKESLIIKDKRIRYLGYLYSLIIKPIEKEIGGKRLIISPDGQLAKIPFEALVSGRNKSNKKPVFLIEKNPIKYIQSASVLVFLRSREKSEVINDNLVAFGDPVYDYDNFKMGKPGKGVRFGRIVNSGEEVRIIAKIFEKKGQHPVVYLREKATEENAKLHSMNRFGYIHFACHVVAVNEFQSLVLSQGIPREMEDGFFSFDEIMNCDYNAQLVVLSACKTSLGKEVKGEGVTGLTRAVMYAGTPAVIASLWKVDDTATKELMIQFYKNLLEKGMEKSEALRQAKLSLLKSKKYSSPTYWSAFVMYGE